MAGEFLDPRLWPLWMKSTDIALPTDRSWPQDLYTSQVRKIQQENSPPWEGRSEDRPTTGLLNGIAVRGELMRPQIKTPWQQIYPLVNHIFPTDNIQSLVRGDPEPPMANLPDIPQKVPSTDDPRVVKALLEAANIGTNAGIALMPVGPVSVAPALAPRIAASRLAQAAKRFLQPRTASAPYEHIPGASTGLLPDLLRADPKTRLEFSRRAPWTDEHGYDVMYGDIGMPGEPTVPGTGRYRNSQGMLEYQPVFIARPGIGRGAEAALDAVEATRGLMGMQEATAWHVMNPPGKVPMGASFDVNLGRVPTAGEMEKLGQIAEAYGLEPANSAYGLSMLRLEGNSSPEFASQLRPGLERQVRQIVPEAKVTQGLHQGNLIDYTEHLAKANEGRGLATRKWADEYMRPLQDLDPVRYDRLINSAGVKQKAAADIARLEEYGGRGTRLDYEKLLEIIQKGGLKGVLDHVAKYGYQGLPVVMVGGALPVIAGKNSSPEDL